MQRSQLQRGADPPCWLRFESLFRPGRGYVFPCDVAGRVDDLALSPRAKANLAIATRAVGREFALPVIRCAED